MKFAALGGVILKLSKLFLRICKWVLLEMSMSCKLCGFFSGKTPGDPKLKRSKDSLYSSNGAWKWRAMLMLMWAFGVLVGFLFPALSLSHGALMVEGLGPKFCQEEGQILLEHFNVSINKFHAIASLLSEEDQMPSYYSDNIKLEMTPSNGIACALKVNCVDETKFEKQQEWLGKHSYSEERRYNSLGDNIFLKFGLSVVENSVSFLSQSKVLSLSAEHPTSIEKVLQSRTVEGQEKGVLGSFSLHLVIICSFIILGLVAACKIASIYKNVWRKVHNLIQEDPLAQPQKQLLQQEQEKVPSRRAGMWRKKLLIVFVLVGLLGSIWLFWHLNKDIVMRRKETLVNMCDERARMLQDQFNVSINHVHALAMLVSTFHHGKNPSALDQKTFEEYTERTAFERPLTSGVAYALKVLHSDREQFEKQQGWTIKKMEIEDQTLVQDCTTENLDPSPVRDEYAPVILSQETVSHIVSIDMMSGKEDRENILRARGSGKGVLTSPFKLLKSNHLGVVLTFAVYRSDLPPNATPEQRIAATMGYLGASYDVPSLVEKLLHQLASKQTIVVNVYDTTNDSAPINMYGPEFMDTGLSHVSHLDFGDPFRNHEMHCRFKQKPSPPWTAIAASVGVMVITLLLGHIFHDAIKQIEKVERDYHEMMELKTRAEAADVAKSQFLATVSHEIRTPIHGVLGMLQMLMDTELDANQLDFAQTAHDSGKDLISLINGVLDQAKIESGRLELEAVAFDLRGVLDNILSLFSGRSREKGIELAVYVSEQVPEVIVGDPGRFRQIITNLVGNSIKFTRNKGHIFVSVHLADEVGNRLLVKDTILKQGLSLVRDRSDNTITLSGLPVVDRWGSWGKFTKLNETNSADEPNTIKLLVTVEDTGIGICHDAQCKIFRPFMQADSSTSRKYGGTGIGLSISKCLVDLMGGEIGFVSEPGIGSTFSFVAAFTRGERSSLCTKRQTFDPSLSEFRGLKALVVDGSDIRAEVTRYHLQRLGICVDTVSSLECACTYLSSTCRSSPSTQVSMILVDEDTRDLGTNLEFLHQIQKPQPNGCIKIPDILPKIYLLVNSMNSNKHSHIKSSGLADDVILKPLRLGILVACLQESHGIGRRQINKGKPSNLGNLLKQRRILVVDDNLVNQKVAEGALKKYGATVTCVGSGKDALERLKPPHHFDACFMDLQMPEMDGFEATKGVRSMESDFNKTVESMNSEVELSGDVRHWHTPILAMTADVIQATNEECIKCGMDGYVTKPFEEEQLYSAVVKFL